MKLIKMFSMIMHFQKKDLNCKLSSGESEKKKIVETSDSQQIRALFN